MVFDMFNADTYNTLTTKAAATGAQLIIVSKEQPNEAVQAAYDAGNRAFGESYVQELLEKKDVLPTDIEWHLVGHLQRNKVRPLIPFITLIHSVDSYRLLKEIDKWAKEDGKVIDVLLQMHISREPTKHGFGYDDLPLMLRTDNFKRLENVRIRGLMGMAEQTDDMALVRTQFQELKRYFDNMQSLFFPGVAHFTELSMGMSSDYEIALEEGATMVRVGSKLFT
jgi:hypothetical protein